MRYQVKISASANETGKRLPPEIKKAAKAALKELGKNPHLGKELQAELSGFRSHRFMRYRIVYTVDHESKTVIVRAIGHRRDIYESLGKNLFGKFP